MAIYHRTLSFPQTHSYPICPRTCYFKLGRQGLSLNNYIFELRLDNTMCIGFYVLSFNINFYKKEFRECYNTTKMSLIKVYILVVL